MRAETFSHAQNVLTFRDEKAIGLGISSDFYYIQM